MVNCTTQALIEHNADVNLKESTLGWRPIDFAKLANHQEMIQHLIKNGALNQITALDKGPLLKLAKQSRGYYVITRNQQNLLVKSLLRYLCLV